MLISGTLTTLIPTADTYMKARKRFAKSGLPKTIFGLVESVIGFSSSAEDVDVIAADGDVAFAAISDAAAS